MFVPAKKDTVANGFDVCMGASDRFSVGRFKFDHFLMKFLVLSPASNHIKVLQDGGEAGDIDVTVDGFGSEEILLFLTKIHTDQELQ